MVTFKIHILLAFNHLSRREAFSLHDLLFISSDAKIVTGDPVSIIVLNLFPLMNPSKNFVGHFHLLLHLEPLCSHLHLRPDRLIALSLFAHYCRLL